MPEDLRWQHLAFDDILARLEKTRKISRQRIADVVTRLMIASPKTPAQTAIAQGLDLAVPSEIPPDSVSRAVAALSSMKLVTPLDTRADRPGRPYTPLQLGSIRWAMVGVKVGHQLGRVVTLTALVTGLDGIPVNLPGYQSEHHPYTRNIPEGDINDADDLVEALADLIEELCDLPQVRQRVILGVGLELAGHVFEGVVVSTSLTYLHNVHLGERLSERLNRLAERFDTRQITPIHRPLPVIIDNDVNVLAVLETYRPRYPERDIAVVAVFEEGVGGGLVLDGRVYRGGEGMAGEIGHCLIPIDTEDLKALNDASPSPNLAFGEDMQPDAGALPSLPGFLDPCHCGHAHHLDCVTPVRILGQLGYKLTELTLTKIAQDNAETPEGLTREGHAFKIAGHALGVGLSILVNLLNPSRVLLLVPPALVPNKPGTNAELYCREAKEALCRHAFSTSQDTVPDIEEFSVEQRLLFGAKATAVRILDSFVQHAKRRCKCYVPRLQPEPALLARDLLPELADDDWQMPNER